MRSEKTGASVRKLLAKTDALKSPRDDHELAARAAWLHFIGGLTQNQVADRLGLSPTRAHRAIARAHSLGLVHISVKATAASCVELENTLIEEFGLSMCRVAMELPEEGPMPLKALGELGGNWLEHVLEKGAHRVIGVSHGRTIAAMVESMGEKGANGTTFVSLLGGLTQSLAANPYDVIHRLALKTGAESYLLPAPLFANSAHDKQVLLSQSMLSDAFSRMREATLAVVGIGDLETSIGARELGSGSQSSIQALQEAGAAAEILGQFIRTDGTLMSSPFEDRTIALPIAELRGREIVAIAGGESKQDAILASLRSGLLSGLIVDEATARGLVNQLNGNSPSQSKNRAGEGEMQNV